MTEKSDDQFTGQGARRMDAIAKAPFALIYPTIARQLLDTCRIREGR